MRIIRHFVRYDLIPLLALLLLCLFPSIFLYARNAVEAHPADMLPFMLVFSASGLLITLVCLPFFRNVSRAAFFAAAAMLVVINFSLLDAGITKLFPWLWSRFVLLFFAVLLLVLFLLLLLKKPDLRIGCTLVLIAFAAVSAMNLGLAVPDIIGAARVEKPDIEPDSETGVVFSTPGPNVYYFMFDEYGGYENLLHYYEYDNSTFLSELEARGFEAARESCNYDAMYTDVLFPNLLNLDYVKRPRDYGVLTDYYMDNSFMVRMFRQNGYQVNLVNHLDFIGTTGCNVLTTGQSASTISVYLLKNSLFSKLPPIRDRLIALFHIVDENNPYPSLENALQTGLDCWQYAQDTPTLTLGYIGLPHSPLIIGRDGRHYRRADHYDWRNPELYLGQLEYTSDYILQLADSILSHDPDALVILQSDHGCRMKLHELQLGDIQDYDPETEQHYMQNILNCVYCPEKDFVVEGETGINTLRKAFREVLGANLDPLEVIYDTVNYSPYVTPFSEY